MRFINISITIGLLIININCKNDTNQKVIDVQPLAKEKINSIPKEKTKKVDIAPDSITSKNAIDFLTAYGKENPETVVLFETRLGNIKVKLYRNTPLHRASFIFLVKQGYFSTTCAHRVVQDFVVQGGNSEHPKTRKFRSEYGYTLPAEFRANRKHKYGTLAAVRDWENNPKKRSTPFEFYFIQDKNGGHHLDGEHTVFGEIISGFNTLEKIALVEVGGDEWPIEDVFFKVSVVK